MRRGYLLICLVLGISLKLTSVTAEKSVIIVARSAGTPDAAHKLKTRTAPLYTSSPRPPIAEVQPTAAPTEASAKSPTIIINAPPQIARTTAKQQVAVESVTEPKPLQTPPTVAVPAIVEATPLQVTGFITKNGTIYEVVDKNGIGRIEGRQNSDTDSAPFVCNYGAVVIYSDVACEEVTNVHVSGVRHKVINSAADNKEEQPAESQQSTAAVQQVAAENTSNSSNADDTNSNTDTSDIAKPNTKPNDDDDDFADFNEVPVVKKRRRGNKKTSGQRKRNDNRQRPNAVREGGGNRRRQQTKRQRPQQHRRRQNNRTRSQQQRRRLQNQQKEQKENRRRYQSGNHNTQRRQNQRRGNNNKTRYIDIVYDYE
nr:uncharacterized protein LOC106615740 [Bactrocera oleae]XP_036227529.1 uncharacterized protein LOC106615740 [Bactrocera oleae]XP_036227530.1 uncharacterized protein LOC106615740 [Bactrocera oleae]XP_036227531.1 uncharacterized protein LOC106615740 [Bactrocera oleae]